MATKAKRIEDMSEEELNRRSGEAYDKAMPSPEPGEQKPRRFGNGGYMPSRSDVKQGLSMPRGKGRPRTKFDSGGAGEAAGMLTTPRETTVRPTGMSLGGMKKGGTASSRADGIAQRGKTRGTNVTMCGGGKVKK